MRVSVRGPRPNVAHRLAVLLQRLRPGETRLLVALGLAVGLGSGLGAVVFRYLISAFTALFFDDLHPALANFLGSAAVVPLPAPAPSRL